MTFMSGMLTSNLWKACVPGIFRLTGTTAEVGSGGYVCDISPSITWFSHVTLYSGNMQWKALWITR